MWATAYKVRFFSSPAEVLQPTLKLWLLQNEGGLFISLYLISISLAAGYGGQSPLSIKVSDILILLRLHVVLRLYP